jgi:hypothetical protein
VAEDAGAVRVTLCLTCGSGLAGDSFFGVLRVMEA